MNIMPAETIHESVCHHLQRFVLGHLQKLDIVDQTYRLVSDFGEVLVRLKSSDSVVDLVDYNVDQLLGLLDKLLTQEHSGSDASEKKVPNHDSDDSPQSAMMLQSRIIKILKITKSMTIRKLRDELKSNYAILCSDETLKTQMKKLEELQFLIMHETEIVEYLP